MIKGFRLIDIKILTLLIILVFNKSFSKNNKLFWDGRDWNRLKKLSEYNLETEFIIKKAYLEGALDGRLFILENLGKRSGYC